MKFTNPLQTNKRLDVNGMHCIQFKPGETKEIPEHLEVAAMESGLIPAGAKAPAKKPAPKKVAVQQHKEE